jgi:hypothetical protein
MTNGASEPLRSNQIKPTTIVGHMVSAGVTLLAWGEILRITHLMSQYRARYLNAMVFNGDFQTFDPIRRLFSGEVLFRDFDVYLGIGPTLLTSLATYFSGGDFGASLYAAMFLCVLFHGLTLFVTAYLCNLGLAAASLIALLCVQLILIKSSPVLPDFLVTGHEAIAQHLVRPASSILGIRTAVAPIVVAVLALTWRWWQIPSVSGDRRRTMTVGLCAGLGVLWSNDSGLPLAVSLIATLTLVWLQDRRWIFLVRNTMLAVAVAGLTAMSLLTLVTSGFPHEWFRFNFLGVARDQFWYFVGNKVLTWGDIPLGWEGMASIICLAWLVTRHFRRLVPSKTSLLIPLLATAFLAGVLSQVGGAINPRYSKPTVRLLTIVGPYVLLEFCLVVWMFSRRARTTGGLSARGSLLDAATCGRLSVIRGICIALVCGMGCVWWINSHIWESAYAALPEHAKGTYFHWEHPRGTLTNQYSKTMACGQYLKNELDRDNVPPRQRLFSTYVSFLDIATDSFNPSRHDLIIHSLGADRRAAYSRDFERSNVRYVCTPRRDDFVFEAWARCLNWRFYEQVFRKFDPVFTTDYSIVWRRRSTIREWIGRPRPIKLSRHGSACIEVRFAIPEEERQTIREKALVLIEFDYETSRAPGALFQGLLRQHLVAFDVNTPFTGLEPCLTWGFPTGKGHAAFPVEGSYRSANVLFVNLEPARLSQLDIRNPTSTVLMPLEEIDDFPEELIWATSWSDGGLVRSGILGNSLFVENPRDTRHLGVGDELEFAGAGRRKIVAIDRNRIEVDGPPLDSATDGFPHPVRVISPHWKGLPVPVTP